MNLLSGAEIQCPLSALERVRIIEAFLMKIYGNFLGTLETVRNRGVRIGEVRLYCNSVLVDFLALFSFNYFQVQGKHNPLITFSKNFFPFFSSHGYLRTTTSESSLVELMQSLGMVNECLNLKILRSLLSQKPEFGTFLE